MTHPAVHLDYKEILKYYQEIEDRRKYNEETYNFLKYGTTLLPNLSSRMNLNRNEIEALMDTMQHLSKFHEVTIERDRGVKASDIYEKLKDEVIRQS